VATGGRGDANGRQKLENVWHHVPATLRITSDLLDVPRGLAGGSVTQVDDHPPDSHEDDARLGSERHSQPANDCVFVLSTRRGSQRV
jgi:hypothetical protein